MNEIKISKISYACATHIGNIREENQDNFYIDGKTASGENETIAGVLESEKSIVAVCDGMGGEANGKLAAKLTADNVAQIDEKSKADESADMGEFILKQINLANDEVYQMALKAGESGGSTINIAFIDGKTLTSYNLGDSRTYICTNKELKQLSRDHTTVADMVRMKFLTEEEAKNHPRRNQLNQFVGVSTKRFKLEPHISDPIELLDGDMILICSDGLTDMCEKPEIIAIMSSGKELKEIADDLVQNALDNGGHDNITVMLLKAQV